LLADSRRWVIMPKAISVVGFTSSGAAARQFRAALRKTAGMAASLMGLGGLQ